MPQDEKPSATFTVYWYGNGGNFCTKEEQEAAAEKMRVEMERQAAADQEMGR